MAGSHSPIAGGLAFCHLLPVGCVANFLVLFKLVADHLKELVGVGTQVLHEAH